MLTISSVSPTPDFWKVFGHSWFVYATGPSGDQTGRVDSLFRSSMDIEYQNWRNYAISGARVCMGGTNARGVGGWVTAMNYLIPSTTRVAPYAPDGGATILCYGINDMGIYGGHLTNVQNTIVDGMRGVISRARASRVFLNTATNFAYGAGWASSASGNDLSTSGTTRLCSSTTTATITFTLPADYTGETVVFGFLKRPDTTGGTVTWSGTAGASGTTYTANGVPSAFVEHGYLVKRFTAFTAANAGQTIIATTTQLDASGNLFFDCAWLESKTPPPVIVLNIAKLTTAGYTNSLYSTWRTGAVNDATMDANINTVNGLVATMVTEFDQMVQIADVDTAINKDATKTSDGIHPNELGAGPVVDAIITARNRLKAPGTSFGTSLGFNSPAPRASGDRRPRIATYYQRQEGITGYTTYAPVLGDEFAIPYAITEGRDIYSTLGIVVTTVGTVAPTLRLTVYSDIEWRGYPQYGINGLDPTNTVMTSATTPAAPSVRDSGGMNLGAGWVSDPGLYWIVLKVDSAGTGQVWQAVTGISPYMPNTDATGITTAFYMGWKLTGQATGVLGVGAFPTTAVPAATVPLIQVKKTK